MAAEDSGGGSPPRGRTRAAGGARRRSLIAIVAGVVLVAAGCRVDTHWSADQRAVANASIRVAGVDARFSGQVGLDLLMGGSWNPCHVHVDDEGPFNDSTYAACQDSSRDRTSYAKHVSYQAGGTVTGLWWENLAVNRCGGQPWCGSAPDILQTMWANKATSWALEFYPDDPAEGGVRIAGGLPDVIGSTAVSPDLGTVRLPRRGQPGTTTLTGAIAGGPWGTFAWEIDVFQREPFTLTTSTGYPEGGFGSTFNGPSSYRMGVFPHGTYHVVVTNLATGASVGVDRVLASPTGTDVLDINPSAPCFGLGVAYVPYTASRVC